MDTDASEGREQRGEEQEQGPAAHAAAVPQPALALAVTASPGSSDGWAMAVLPGRVEPARPTLEEGKP